MRTEWGTLQRPAAGATALGGRSGNLALMGGLTVSRPTGDSRSEHEGTPSLERGTPIVPPRKLEDAKTWIGFYKYPE